MSQSGKQEEYKFCKIDSVINILSVKLTALVGRDEPKDVFDIVTISKLYSFNWIDIFTDSKSKAMLNEIDIVERLSNFPVEMLRNIDWLIDNIDYSNFKNSLNIVANEFFMGKDNSLCDALALKIEKAGLINN